MQTMLFLSLTWDFLGVKFSNKESLSGINCIYPSDLVPFTRRPLFLVIDGDNNDGFEASK